MSLPPIFSRRRVATPWLALAALGWAASCQSQSAVPPNEFWREPPKFEEMQVQLPTVLRTEALVAVPLSGSELRLGVDPESLSIGTDGVVRYVMVAISASGTVNAVYEGVRCNTGEVKVYARHYPDSGWKAVAASAWQKLGAGAAHRPTMAVVRHGICMTDGRPRTASEIVRDLRTGKATRYEF